MNLKQYRSESFQLTFLHHIVYQHLKSSIAYQTGHIGIIKANTLHIVGNGSSKLAPGSSSTRPA
jgi:hypothetical protein